MAPHGQSSKIDPSPQNELTTRHLEKKKGLRGQDLNLRPSGYEPDELPGCSTPRLGCASFLNRGLSSRPKLAWSFSIAHLPAMARPLCVMEHDWDCSSTGPMR